MKRIWDMIRGILTQLEKFNNDKDYTMDLARIISIGSSGVTKGQSWDKMMIGDLLRTPFDINELTVSGESARIAATISAEQVPSFVTVIPKAAQIQ